MKAVISKHSLKSGKRIIEKVPVMYLQEFSDSLPTWLFFQAQLAQKTTLVNDSKLKEQELREQVRVLFEHLRGILVGYVVFAVLKGLFFSSDGVAHLHTGTMEIICM